MVKQYQFFIFFLLVIVANTKTQATDFFYKINGDSLSVSYPTEGSEFNEIDSITIDLNIQYSTDSIDKIEFFADTIKIGETNSDPYSFTWKNLSPGNPNVFARLFHALGDTIYSDTVNILITEFQPGIEILNPSEGEEFDEGTNITFLAQVEMGNKILEKVDFYWNEMLLASKSSPPYEHILAGAGIGDHAAKAILYYEEEDSVISEEINFSVIDFIPEISLLKPLDNQVFNETESIEILPDILAGNDTIVKVEYYADTEFIGESNTAPFSLNWENVNAGTFDIKGDLFTNKDTVSSAPIAITVDPFIPTATILAPENNATYDEPASLQISAEVELWQDTVNKVTFYADTDILFETPNTPFEYNWTEVGEGIYGIFAKFNLTSGDSLYSDTVNVTVNAFTPSISITSPLNNETFNDLESIQIETEYSIWKDSIARVDFFKDSVLINQDTEEPYAYLLENLDSGLSSLMVRMYLESGDFVDSELISVNVVPFQPEITITSPTNNQEFNEYSDILLEVNTTVGLDTILEIIYYNAVNPLDTVTIPPYSFDYQNVEEGNYKFIGKMRLKSGEEVVSDTVSVKVNPFMAEVSIQQPAENQEFFQDSVIKIVPNYSIGEDTISAIHYYVDNKEIGSVTQSPFSINWFSNKTGEYDITAKMYLTSGDSAISNPVNVFVVALKPVLSLTSPTSNATFKVDENIPLSVNISNPPSSITKVEYLNGNTVIKEATSAPYASSWDNATLGNYNISARLIAESLDTIYSGSVSIKVEENVIIDDKFYEAEQMELTNYQIEEAPYASNGKVIGILSGGDGSVGTASFTFNGETDTYRIVLAYFDENDGKGSIEVNIGGKQVSSFVLDQNLGSSGPGEITLVKKILLTNTEIAKGTEIEIKGVRQGGEWTRIDFMEFQTLDGINIPPVSSLSSPTNGDSFEKGSTIVLEANASDPDGLIQKVRFMAGEKLLGEDNTNPYSYSWANVEEGDYELKAIAFDDQGDSTVSDVVEIKVAAPGSGECATTYAENDGLLIIEGEEATLTGDWKFKSDLSGYTGQGYIEWDGPNYFDKPVSDILTFNITINKTGTYKFQWHSRIAKGNLPSENNDTWFKVENAKMFAEEDGAIVYPKDGYNAPSGAATSYNSVDGWFSVYHGIVNAWSWRSYVISPLYATFQIFVEFDKPGEYELQIAPRSNGHAIDRLILFHPESVLGDVARDLSNNETYCSGAVVNKKPVVKLTKPANNTILEEDKIDIILEAEASDEDGEIAKVEFFQGSTLLGSTQTSPYNFLWEKVEKGIYNLTAKATDNSGAVVTSSVVSINVGNVDPNNSLPTATIISPKNGAKFDIGEPFIYEASASDSDGEITKVDFYYNGNLLNTDSTAPYKFTWETTIAEDYELTVKAYDDQGGVTTSELVLISINSVPGNLPPTISMKTPKDNATFTSTALINLEATTIDKDGSISIVEFYINGEKVGEDETEPYTYLWAKPEAGPYSIYARAIDNQGSTGNSQLINVIVQDVDNPQSPVQIISPAQDTTINVDETIEIVTQTGKDYGIDRVVFLVDGQNAGEDDTFPFTRDLTFKTEGVFTLTVKAFNSSGATYVSDPVRIGVGEEPGPLGINKGDEEKIGLNLYPNPSSGSFNVNFNVLKPGNLSLKMVNFLGKEVYQENVGMVSGENIIPLELTGNPAGLYLVILELNEEVFIKKIMLE
ncbi:Ig-like domain-containing protein [Flexithrix dorotheae]|uniref:Ig-like domain-containing protein n=1 Tax=Flexithrix dorotheae TaxID=70993 RepID=UPI00036FD2D7|nr:Ig-like domain-containing protein [Flexithrix dorotheae]